MIRSIAPVDEHARSAPATEPRDRSVTVTPWLVVLFAAALALRLVGITYGLPTVFHPDEPTSINEATALLHGGQDALTFANPPLYKYMLVAVFAVLGPVTQLDRSSLFVIARAVSALFGALTILPTYAIGRMVRDRQTGLVAAVLASATLLQVRESHFGVNDALATFCSTLALAAIVRIACRGSRRDYVLAGAGVGLAFAAKYQCAAVLIPLLLAHASNHWRARTAARHDGTSAPGLRWRRTLRWDAHQDLLIALGVAGLTAVVAFPPLVTESRRVVADVYVFLMLPSRLGFEGLDPSGAYPFYVNSLGWDVGWPILLLAAIASAFAVARRDWAVLVVASLPVALYVVMG
ncbi:MAG: glycosyltransferase family 39 protein, partial [Chloroflexi bacterium]|nr:glycosyltransferase family 39 protein [Chloroflexota bacterium]